MSGFAERFRELRERAGIDSIEEFANETGLSADWARRIEKESDPRRVIPTPERIVDWKEKLDLDDVEVEELIARRQAEWRGMGDRWNEWSRPAKVIHEELRDEAA